MTIRTRPAPPGPTIVGRGVYKIGLTYEQLQLLGAFLSITKLGFTTYQEAARQLIDILEELTDDSDFAVDSLGVVLPRFQIHDDSTYTVLQTVDATNVSIDV